jgi:predicted N-formylglutamate amidohydrolase
MVEVPPEFVSRAMNPQGNTMDAVEIVNPTATTPLLIICDHASNRVPEAMNNLGLGAADLARHIGWDIGAAAVTRNLARSLAATAILARTSRLVIDPNRDPTDATSIPEISDRVRIPANCHLTPPERARRCSAYFHPYHDAIVAEIARLAALGTPPAIFSVHSFTPEMPSEERPWHIGVLWNKDPRMAMPMIEALQAHPDGLAVGDNQPYSGQLVAYSLNRHGGGNGLPHCAVEIRQDLVGDDAAAERWAGILAPALRTILAGPELHHMRHY